MTKVELIELLNTLPDDAIIRVYDHNGAITYCTGFNRIWGMHTEGKKVYLLK
jgi:hypothetical protein